MAKYLDLTGLAYFWGKLKDYFQPKLVSGTNIKTINSTSLLGSGNISISGGDANVGSVMGRYGGNTTTTFTSASSYKQIPLSNTLLDIGDAFDEASNAIEMNYDGIVHFVGYVRFTESYTANDYIQAQIHNKGSAGTSKDISLKVSRVRTPFAAYNGDVIVEVYAQVEANDVIELRACNVTGGRGKVDNSLCRLTAEYVRYNSAS